MFYLLLFFAGSMQAQGATVKDSLKFLATSKEYVVLKPSSEFVIDLRYGSSNNFVGRDLYGEFNRGFLHRIAAEKFALARKNLAVVQPKYKLIVFDALRPRSVQAILWDKVKGTDQEKYVADPKSGSVHNYGFALDLSLVDENGRELDMGTPFDSFSPLAQPDLEKKFLAEGKLTEPQLQNRLLLRKTMEEAGFIQLPIEWWHYDALPKQEAKAKYKIIE